jgi:hypothetical protein
MGLEMNPNWEQQLQDQIADRMRPVAADLQDAMDAVADEYAGQDIDEVKPALTAAWTAATGGEGELTDPELSQFAEQIASGGRVEVRLQ